MKKFIFTKSLICLLAFSWTCNAVRATNTDALTGDGTLRCYRLAIPITKSAYAEDLSGNYNNAIRFWQECEAFVNKMFIPLGFCFDVVEDSRLINLADLPLNPYNGLPEIGNCTYNLNQTMGAEAYDVAMWVMHRDDFEENTGLSALKGAYSSNTKGSGYAKTDKWVVAHELGHMFGAVHTLQGEGSLMDNTGEYFSYPSIKAIRNSAIGATSYNNIEVTNNAPVIDANEMQKTYRIPQGACLAIDVHATDVENHQLMYTAIGCTSANVDNVQEGSVLTLPFASFAPQESRVIRYAPTYTADYFYEDYFYLKDGTGIHEMSPGTYPLSILVNDVPNAPWSYTELTENPFYSAYAIWETQVEIIAGTPFSATLNTEKRSFTAGEKVTLKWGVNSNYFTPESRLRITLSADYGETFPHLLADNIPALNGEHTFALPNIAIGQVEVDFTTAKRMMNGGIIKIEEIGGVAFTQTALNPMDNQSFTLAGNADHITPPSSLPHNEACYDLLGHPVMKPTKGAYIVNGKKVIF